MKILVTGHRGFIGGHIYRTLVNQGYSVRGMEWGDPFPDVTDLDWVIHIGGLSSTTERDIEKIMRQNYDFSCDLLDACANAGVSFQYASSASVYGKTQDFRECAPVNPLNAYAWSKFLFERYVQKNFVNAPIQIQGFRYFNVYGDGEEHKGNQASPFTRFRQQAEQRGFIELFVDSHKYFRDFVPVDRVVEIHRRFLTVPESGIWNLGSGKAISFQDIAESFGCEIKFISMPETLSMHYQNYTCADLTKLLTSLQQ